jgi:8-oxo-dGTP pyrophosphatase MutT (NUDIX family)
MKNPWKKLNSKIVYKNPWITVKEDKVIKPDNKKGIYGVVHLSGGTEVVALTSKKEIYLVGQWRYAINKFSWSLPAGSVKKNEKFLKAAKNELEEEAGIKAKNWKYLGISYQSVGVLNQKIKYYLATDLTKTEQKLEGSKKGMKVIKIPLEKAVRLIKQNKIFEDSTITGIFKAIEYLKNNKLKL